LVTVDLETTFSTIVPGNTISLQYTIENRGNVDLILNPALQLPLGWTHNTNFEEINLPWTESRNFIIPITAELDARGGDITLQMNSGINSWSHTESVNVTILAEPEMTFASVEIEGETWTNVFGPGQHPIGVAINYTWVVQNLADTIWEPSVTLQLEPGMFGDCESPGQISRGDVKAVTCTVIIPTTADPGEEPEFTVELSAEQISVNDTVTMLVASNKELIWKIDAPSVVKTGETNNVELNVTNRGNTLVSGRVDLSYNDDWEVEIKGLDTINLQAGQSQIIRLSITAIKPGDTTFSATLSNVDDVQGSQFDWNMTSEGKEVTDESSSNSDVILWSFSIISIIILVGFAVLVITNRKSAPKSGPTAPNNSALTENIPSENTTPCFSCRQPILSWMLGCPSCGARYHSVCKVESCVNCGADSSTFVNVE